MVVILMGVASSGKTTVGRMLAARVGWRFFDGDDLHPAANRLKMSAGEALTDDDRRPWLAAIRNLIADSLAGGTDVVLACSALKKTYRDTLGLDPSRVRFIYLKGSEELVRERALARRGHFFDPALIHSQFEALEEPQDAIVEDITRDPETIVASIVCQLGLASADAN